ncbi:MAG TPA: LLM class flavin-dependent oxidoreductase [Acidimicrobiia bacterium]|nr:LLM class flavin-dependent oxidoreductase [Acidimicrobiia bacterium]
MHISCAFPAGPKAVDHIVEAEQLGYERAWLYDSPALYGDVWVIAALAAQRTSRIGIGPAVLVPNLRHPLTQASAIATLEQLAPGRIVVAIGTGFTGRMAMGQKPLTWKYTRRYIEQLRGLLRGEKIEVDGGIVQMLHHDDFAPRHPINTPIVVAANGPKGLEVARELGDGVMTIATGNSDFAWCAVLAFGTVLDAGEDATSERVAAAAGPGQTVVYHAMWEGNPESVDALPGGAEWRKHLEELPENERHLAVHEDHLVQVTKRDRVILQPDLIPSFTWTAPAADLRARIDGLEAAGATEILYGPMGPDVSRELRAFMEMATA